MKLKKHLIRYAFVYFVIILIFTFLSRTVRNWGLAEVEVVSIQSGTVSKTINAKSILEPMKKTEILAKADCKINEVYISNGQIVNAGDKLFKINTEEMSEILIKKELEIKRLEHNHKLLKQNAVSKNFDQITREGFDIDRQFIELDIESVKKEYEILKRALDSPIIYAESFGMVSDLNIIKGSTVLKGQEILAVTEIDKGYKLNLDINSDDVSAFLVGLEINIETNLGVATAKVESISGVGETKQIRLINITFPQLENVNLSENLVSITHKYSMAEGVLLLDKSSLYKINDNSYYVYTVSETEGIFGKERKVLKKSVEIGAKGDQYVEILGGIDTSDKVIISSSIPIIEGDRVR